ncbi:PH domain-containing protein [Kitasatospora xanthocidica]|uniref:PH domain-containing protein n=1 Tax=Kitasatospora xanthocidica TaxID=83382 RepID=UPI0016756A2E|nr:PH domain-containing protein [Kitasatospora xanthocidica]
MDEIRLGLGRRDLLRSRWTIVGMSVLFGGVAAACWWLPGTRTGNRPDPDRGAFVIGIAVLWLVIMLRMVNQAVGTTRLTPDHVHLRGLVMRRSIPWAEITRFEERRRTTPRAGPYWQVRLHRANGRPLTMPGFHTSGRRDHAFAENLRRLNGYRASVTDAVRPPRS